MMQFCLYSLQHGGNNVLYKVIKSALACSLKPLINTVTTMLQMGLQYLATKRMRFGYEKLTSKRMMRVGKRCIWVKSLNGKLRGLRLSRSRKFFSTMLFSSRILRIYNEIVNKIMNMENSYPVIVLPTQWGLPVLSHPSVVCRRSVMVPPNRKVIFY
jgi:hypothetical protein